MPAKANLASEWPTLQANGQPCKQALLTRTSVTGLDVNFLHTITLPINKYEPIKISYSVQSNQHFIFLGGGRKRIRREEDQDGEVSFSSIEKMLQVSSKPAISEE